LCPEHWYLTDLSGDTDFGFDYQIQAENQRGQIAYVFFSQLKGTTSPTWVDNGSVLSFSVETKTLNLYLRTAEPVLFVVVDLSGEVPHGYYLWIQDYLRTLLVEDEQTMQSVGGWVAARLCRVTSCNAHNVSFQDVGTQESFTVPLARVDISYDNQHHRDQLTIRP
jgi:hypothetical protein